ncbi:helix-turn-helix domain-containing protein [Streptomyces sp. NBC_00091]|uniref:helix-turn-helix domain-containing protein n=1 Tax=Streptomyces sp. NBC_00091 TaxID=2975648 RepID=UPI0022574F82|nr:helix-turn-helix transcriptional regulator [Streptomyces sp. NBC_00091]MCX5377303.1 helix-turn-helix transcriptional regulator [Streptomyces sp. NBC_00091]
MARKDDEDELKERDLAYRIAQAVHDRRTQLGWSQRRLAEAADMRQPHISRLEAAKSLPSLDVLRRVSEALGTDLVVSLVPREADPAPHAPMPTDTNTNTTKETSR